MEEYRDSKQGVTGLWEEAKIRDSFTEIKNESDIFNLLSRVEVGILEDASSNHETMNKEIYFIRANYPWDVEHGIEFEISLEEIKKGE